MKVNDDWDSSNSLFVESWIDDTLDDTEECEVLLEEDVVTTGLLSFELIVYCSDGEKALIQPENRFSGEQMISRCLLDFISVSGELANRRLSVG